MRGAPDIEALRQMDQVDLAIEYAERCVAIVALYLNSLFPDTLPHNPVPCGAPAPRDVCRLFQAVGTSAGTHFRKNPKPSYRAQPKPVQRKRNRIQERPGVLNAQDRRLAAFNDMGRTLDRRGRIHWNNLADHQVIKEHLDGSQVLLDRLRRAWVLFDAGRDVHRRDENA